MTDALSCAHPRTVLPPGVLNSLGNTLVQLERFEEAITLYARAINADPTYARPYHNLALLYQLADEVEPAIELYRRYLVLAPDDGEAHHNLALLYKESGRDEDAHAAFDAAAEHLRPDTPERATNLGVGNFFRGNLDAACSMFKQALTLDATHVPARYHLGVTHLCLGRCKEAIEDLQAVLDAAPDYPQAAVNLAVAYNTDGQAGRAVNMLEVFLGEHPDDASAVLNLGFAYHEAGRGNDAVQAFRRVTTLSQATAEQTERAEQALRDLESDGSSGTTNGGSHEKPQ